MVKLTAEIIQQSYQYLNPIRERELDLRGSNSFYLFHSDLWLFIDFRLYYQAIKFRLSKILELL